MKKLLILFCALLSLIGPARAEELSFALEGDHVTGAIRVNGYTFAIDATLTDNRPEAGHIAYASRAIDRAVWEAALTARFPQQAETLTARMIQWAGDVVTTTDYPVSPFPAVLPASENNPDPWLTARLEACAAFLSDVGVAYDPHPFSAAYVMPRPGRAAFLYLDPSDRDKAIGANICFLLTHEQTPLTVWLQLGRYNGSIDHTGAAVASLHPTAQFFFDMDGSLLDFQIAILDTHTSGALPADFLPWEDALTLMLREYASNDIIQRNLQAFSYTVTDIRCAWDMDFHHQGRPGWMISLCAKSADDDSPTGWINRYTTAFVYGAD